MILFLKQILLLVLLLLLGCDNSNSPFNDSEPYNLISVDIGEVRDLDFSNDRLYIATESEGIYIYEIQPSSNSENDIMLSDGSYLTTLYENVDWGEGKDIRSIKYSENTNMLYALDRFGYTYHNSVDYLLGQLSPFYLSCSDTLIANMCSATQTHATKFALDDGNESPELYILYKHNADNELYTEESYSSLKFMNYVISPLNSLGFCELFGTCENEAITIDDSLSYNVNDIFYVDDKLYVANPNKDISSFSIYEKDGGLIDSYVTDSDVKSIYAVNDYIVAGTKNGCYITLLEGDGISSDEVDKLFIADGYSINNIHFDGNKLILSAGIEGVIVYSWDGNSMNLIEGLRIHSSYAYTARFINEMYFIATKNGLEIYQLGG
tara:strand:+ start:16 stop:1155 length:1140 start_codon:yes stop_codon:yes gene_type:complete